MTDEWKKFREEAKAVEEDFAKNLENPVWANGHQNRREHWDVQGTFNGELLKFDVKGLKKFNRKDPETQDEMACVEYVGVAGFPGWVQGEADYVVFKRKEYLWLVVDRQELWDMVKQRLEERNYSESTNPWYEKEPYATYDRSYFGKKDKFCWVPYKDIERLNHTKIKDHE